MVKEIRLTQGQVALVDDEDFDYLNQWKWTAYCDVHFNNREVWYAKFNRNGSSIPMHRIILGEPKGKMVDHINGDGLDNRQSNLRIVTNRQNQQNRHYKKTSKYPGVYWHSRDKRWRAQTKIQGKQKYLGQFKSEKEAFYAYKNAIHEITGEQVILELGNKKCLKQRTGFIKYST